MEMADTTSAKTLRGQHDTLVPTQLQRLIIGVAAAATLLFVYTGQGQSSNTSVDLRRNLEMADDDNYAQHYDKNDQNDVVTDEPPWISVLIPTYKDAATIKKTLTSVLNQTHPHIHVLISFDPSDESEASVRIVKDTLASYPLRAPDVMMYRHSQHMGWIANTNFLLGKVTDNYTSYMPADDYIPANYYEKLAGCLDQHPKAINCYPYIKNFCTPELSSSKCTDGLVLRQPSITGEVEHRVVASARAKSAEPFRGLVRRVSPSDIPYNMTLTHSKADYCAVDMLQLMKQAISGEMIEVDVPYYKLRRKDSVYEIQINNKTFMSTEQFAKNLVQHHAELYHYGHMYAPRSSKFFFDLNVMVLKSKFADLRMDTSQETIRKKLLAKINKKTEKRVAVLGGGIQGTMMALLFAKHGYDVTIFENATRLLSRASSNQEGKIHLGMVYSMDKTMKTGYHMMHSALNFAPSLEHLLDEKIDWNNGQWKAREFTYLVPHTSLISPEDLEAFFAKLQQEYTRLLKEDPALTYLGLRPDKLYRRVPLSDNKYLNSTYFAAKFETEEMAVSHKKLKAAVLSGLERKSVRILRQTYVSDVRRLQGKKEGNLGRFRVFTNRGDRDVDVVVNCLWEGRRAIDRRMHVPDWSGTNVRLKFGIKAGYTTELKDVPSATIVNGPYGDFVNYPATKEMYFSWYPVSMLGLTNNKTLNAEWQAIASGSIPKDMEQRLLRENEAAFNSLFVGGDKPFHFVNPHLVGGFIVGNGRTDIQDPKSELHLRDDEPIYHDDGYFSISTQKFTMGPHNAVILEQRYLNKNNEQKKTRE